MRSSDETSCPTLRKPDAMKPKSSEPLGTMPWGVMNNGRDHDVDWVRCGSRFYRESPDVWLRQGIGVFDARRRNRRCSRGGFAAQLFGYGNSATFSFYAALFAVFGAILFLFSYRRLIKV
jgi:hypothetical protein